MFGMSVIYVIYMFRGLYVRNQKFNALLFVFIESKLNCSNV